MKRILKRGIEKKKKKQARAAASEKPTDHSEEQFRESDGNAGGGANVDVTEIESATLTGKAVSSGILSDVPFSSLKGRVSDQTMRGLTEMGLTQMTKVQAESIPHLLQGR